MAFGFDDLAVGGLSAVGNIVGGLISSQSSRSNTDHAFNQSMEASNTAHQREVADLRAAGLNPALSLGGSGASTVTATPSDAPDLSGAVGTGINTAMAHQRQKQELEGVQTTIDTQKQQQKNLKAEEGLTKIQGLATQKNTEMQVMKNELMMKTLKAQIQKAQVEGDWAQVNQIFGALGSASGIASDLLAAPEKAAKKVIFKNVRP